MEYPIPTPCIYSRVFGIHYKYVAAGYFVQTIIYNVCILPTSSALVGVLLLHFYLAVIISRQQIAGRGSFGKNVNRLVDNVKKLQAET